MSKFTEGKWEVEIIYGDHCAVFANEYLVADCFGNEANARLIVAAPEMYELLSNIALYIEATQKLQKDYLAYEFSDYATRVKELLAQIDGEAKHE